MRVGVVSAAALKKIGTLRAADYLPVKLTNEERRWMGIMRRSNMKLFVWENIDLGQAYLGVVFAFAKDKEQARKLILAKYKRDGHSEKSINLLIAGMMKGHQVVWKPEGFYQEGGEE